MGYTTDFSGCAEFNKPLSKELADYINNFSRRRHVKRDVDKIKEMDPAWKDHCFNGDLGPEGLYYLVPLTLTEKQIQTDLPAGKLGKKADNTYYDPFGQLVDVSVINSDCPPKGCPELWCQWIITDNGVLEWDGGEKFYSYKEWLEFLIEHFFAPSGYILNGAIEWQGEDRDDYGTMVIENNVVTQHFYE